MQGEKRGKAAWLSAALFVLLCMMFTLPCHAVALDGRVDNSEWWDYAKTTLLQGDSLCGITRAVVCHSVDAEGGAVTFGFSVNAPGCERDAPVGAAFWTEGQVFARWQQGAGGSIDTANYSIAGAAHVPEPDENFNDYYMYEIAISSKGSDHTAFFQMLRTLQLQLFDPQGVVSKTVGYPVQLPVPEPAAQPTTTIKTTTTKATTAATQKPTTTKTTATQKPVTTTKTAQPPAATANIQSTTAQHATAHGAEQKTSVIWYTVPITAAGEAPDGSSTGDGNAPQEVDDTLLAEQMQAAQAAAQVGADAPVLLEAAPEGESVPPSLRGTLLFGTAGVLAVLGVLLWFLWRKAQKSSAAHAPAEGEPEELKYLDDDED